MILLIMKKKGRSRTVYLSVCLALLSIDWYLSAALTHPARERRREYFGVSREAAPPHTSTWLSPVISCQWRCLSV